jgi:hypothetical protein
MRYVHGSKVTAAPKIIDTPQPPNARHNHQSPITNHQSPITNHFSLLTSRFSIYSPILQSMIPRLFIPLVCICVALFLNGCASSAKSDYKDYTLAVGAAYPNEARLAQERVTKYLEHLSPDKKARLTQNDYLAVESTEVAVSEVPGLSGRVIGQTGDLTDRASQMAKFIMIFDTKTGQAVGNEGYIVLDTPAKGKLGVFGGYTAVYIGTGK